MIKKISLIGKRIYENEKEKKERKKSKTNSSIKPKGFLARKLGVISFWTLFGFMFLIVVISLFSGDSVELNADNVIIQENYSTSPEAIQYAKNFARDYFTWTVSDEGKHQRKEVMKKYLAQGLNEYAGLNFEGLEWNAKYKDSEIKEVVEKGDNLSQITLLVKFDLIKKSSEKDKKDEVKPMQKYFVVPVAYDGITFGIYELPKFSYMYEDTTLKEVKTEQLKQAEVKESQQIKEFLPTFFKSYAEDTKDKLNYIITNETVTNGLNQTMLFEKVNDAKIFKGDEENSFVVFAEVIFVEPQTNITLTTNYQLSVIRQDDRYIVSGIDDQKNKAVITKEPKEDAQDLEQEQEAEEEANQE